MKNLRIYGRDEKIYLGNTYRDCLKSLIKDIYNDNYLSAEICELYHIADIKVRRPDKWYNDTYKEFIYDTKKEFVKDHYNIHTKRRKDYLKDMKSKNIEVYNVQDIIKQSITEEVIDKWCRDQINDETGKITDSYIIVYSTTHGFYLKYDIMRTPVHDCDKGVWANTVAISVKCTRA